MGDSRDNMFSMWCVPVLQLPCVSSVLKTLKSLVAMKPNSLSQASERVATISAMDVSPPTLDRRL